MERYKPLPELPAFFENNTYNFEKPFVVAHTMAGSDHVGEFLGFDLTEHMVAMEGPDKVVTNIPFSDLRFLTFSDRLHLSSGMKKMVPPLESYQIVFRDTKSLSGKTYSHKVYEHGLHVYSLTSNNRIEQLFIPIDTISDYTFGSSAVITPAAQFDSTSNNAAPLGVFCNTRDELMASLSQYSSYLGPEEGVFSNKRIGEVLVAEKIITPEALSEAIRRQELSPERKLGVILESMGQITTEQINQKLAAKLGIPLVALKHFDVDVDSLNSVPREFCRRYHLLPLFYFKEHLVVALDDPLNFEGIDIIRFLTGKVVDSVLATSQDLDAAINLLPDEQAEVGRVTSARYTDEIKEPHRERGVKR